MKNKVFKKTVDSVRKRSERRGFALKTRKTLKKRVIYHVSVIKNTPKSRIAVLMQDSAIRITALILIITINWLGISAVGKTSAYFTDTEASEGNTFSAGTLDFSLSSPTANFVPENENDGPEDGGSLTDNYGIAYDSKPDKCGNNRNKNKDKDNKECDGGAKKVGFAAREIQIEKIGDSMNFRYAPATNNITGDCGDLTLAAELAGENKYSGDLAGFDLKDDPVVISESGKDAWKFIVGFNTDSDNDSDEDENEDGSTNRSCVFTFSFHAWQIDLGPESGFNTEKQIWNTVELDQEDDSEETNDSDNADSLSLSSSGNNDSDEDADEDNTLKNEKNDQYNAENKQSNAEEDNAGGNTLSADEEENIPASTGDIITTEEPGDSKKEEAKDAKEPVIPAVDPVAEDPTNTVPGTAGDPGAETPETVTTAINTPTEDASNITNADTLAFSED